ncbi:hypothetical protein LVJ94_07885 [Pendulispora rubella]|uniref:Uncharacterized protein n=1 Tax=Pendulispora rubella TaxID=2741070 RepID=A0ABZ2LC62_9BACT
MLNFRRGRSNLLFLLAVGMVSTSVWISACGSDSPATPTGDAGGDVERDAAGPGDPGDGGSSPDVNDGSVVDGNVPGNACRADLQKDAKNCGACGHDCLGASCAAGLCEPERLSVGGMDDPRVAYALAADATNVYWRSSHNDSDAGRVYDAMYAVPKVGGPTRLVAKAAPGESWSLKPLVVANGNLYWINDSRYGFLTVPVGGGAVTAVYAGGGTIGDPGELAIGPGYLYFANFCSGLSRIPLPSGTPQTLQSEGCNYFMRRALAIDPGARFAFVTHRRSIIWQTNLADPNQDTNTKLLHLDNNGPIAADATRVYFTSGDEVKAMPIAGGAAVTVAAPLLTRSRENDKLLVDAKGLYWGKAAIVAARFGGTPFVLYPHPVEDFVVDGRYVYFTSGAGVFRLAK